jgi:hypothetical protein
VEQVIKSISEVRKASDLTNEIWKPLEEMVQVRGKERERPGVLQG